MFLPSFPPFSALLDAQKEEAVCGGIFPGPKESHNAAKGGSTPGAWGWIVFVEVR